MPRAIKEFRGIQINPEELSPDDRIELRLDDLTSLVVEVRNGELYVDPEMNSQFGYLSMGEAEAAARDWQDRAEAVRAASRKPQQGQPLEIDTKELEASGRNSCRVIIGGRRGLQLHLGEEVVLEFWYAQPLRFIHAVELVGTTLRSVTLTTRVGQRELVA